MRPPGATLSQKRRRQHSRPKWPACQVIETRDRGALTRRRGVVLSAHLDAIAGPRRGMGGDESRRTSAESAVGRQARHRSDPAPSESRAPWGRVVWCERRICDRARKHHDSAACHQRLPEIAGAMPSIRTRSKGIVSWPERTGNGTDNPGCPARWLNRFPIPSPCFYAAEDFPDWRSQFVTSKAMRRTSWRSTMGSPFGIPCRNRACDIADRGRLRV